MQTASAAFWTIQDQDIPIPVALGLLAALLIEAALFLATASTALRERLARWPPMRLAAGLTLATPVTCLIAGGGEPWQCAATTAIAGLFAYWYMILPRNNVSDLFLLAAYGAVALGKVSALLYPAPWFRAPAPFVGELAWLRTLIFAVLIFRKAEGIGYGFLPTRAEWMTGIRWFLFLVPVAGAIGYSIGFARPRSIPPDSFRLFLNMAGTFAGHFLFVALREEFLFRGVLLPRMRRWMGPAAGLLVTSAVFGLVHLPMGEFPNWKFALVAAIAGWFYGQAYLATGSIRSAMVTHALTNVVARVFLTT